MTSHDLPDPERPTPQRFLPAAKVAAPILAALLVGSGAGYAFSHHSSTPAASAGSSSNASSAEPGGGPGGIDGEQRVAGTLAAKTASTITVKASGGSTATYTVDTTSQIIRNGQNATLSDVVVGDPVFVHVYPSSTGTMLVERLFAGSSATDGGDRGPGFGPPPANGGTATTPTTTTHI